MGSGEEVVFLDCGWRLDWAEDLEHGVKSAVSWISGLLGEAQGFFFLEGEGEGLELGPCADEFGDDLFYDVIGEIGDNFCAVAEHFDI